MKIFKFLKTNTFYWLLLFIILYLFSCQSKQRYEPSELSANNLLATIILQNKHYIDFVESDSKLHILTSENIPSEESKRINKLISSTKSNVEIYLELAGTKAFVDYVDAIEDTDEKNYTRKFIKR